MGFLSSWFGSPDEVRLTREELTEALSLIGTTPAGLAGLAKQDSAELSRRAAEETKNADTAEAAVLAAYNKQLRQLQLERDGGLANAAYTRGLARIIDRKAQIQASLAGKLAG
ncbi:hypothetical protein HYW46_03810 [Candidatus Daviesbacteria bacterium]|nr:hypothetical protein [Candidatus Daviesbacteria bacterium]